MHLSVQRLLVAPLLVWAVHVSTSFALLNAHCRRGAIGGELIGFSAIRLILLAATAVAAIAIAANGISAGRGWLATRHAASDASGARAQLLLTSAVVSGVALLYLAWAIVFATQATLCR